MFTVKSELYRGGERTRHLGCVVAFILANKAFQSTRNKVCDFIYGCSVSLHERADALADGNVTW